MNRATFDLDDADFELSTRNLVRPVSITKLESAADMVQEENDHALADATLRQAPSSGPNNESPHNITNDELSNQLILAQAKDLKEYQEILRYTYCRNSDMEDNESVPVDYFDEENDEVSVIAGEHGSFDQ